MGKAERVWLMGCAEVEISLGDSKREIWREREVLSNSETNFSSI